MCTFCTNLNKTTAKQPSGALCRYNLSYRKMDLKSRYNPNLPNLPFGCKWYMQPFDLIKRNFNKNVYSKKVVSANF